MNRDELHSPRGTVYLIPWGRWVALDPPVSLERLSMPPAVGTADGIFQLWDTWEGQRAEEKMNGERSTVVGELLLQRQWGGIFMTTENLRRRSNVYRGFLGCFWGISCENSWNKTWRKLIRKIDHTCTASHLHWTSLENRFSSFTGMGKGREYLFPGPHSLWHHLIS